MASSISEIGNVGAKTRHCSRIQHESETINDKVSWKFQRSKAVPEWVHYNWLIINRICHRLTLNKISLIFFYRFTLTVLFWLFFYWSGLILIFYFNFILLLGWFLKRLNFNNLPNHNFQQTISIFHSRITTSFLYSQII